LINSVSETLLNTQEDMTLPGDIDFSILQPFLAASGLLGTVVLESRNGLFKMIRKVAKQDPKLHSGTPLKTTWTCFQSIDRMAAFFILFFDALYDNMNPALSLQGLQFLGQTASIYMIINMEGLRSGNRGLAIAQ